MRKIIYISLVFLGISILIYPNVQSSAAQRTQEQMLNDYINNEMTVTLPFDITDEDVAREFVNESEEIIYVDDFKLDEQVVENTNTEKKIEKKVIPAIKKIDPKEKAIGILEIDSIDLKQVIMPTSSQKDLLISVGHVTETSWIDTEGNLSIAGHRSKRFGRNFNRLEEVEIGDEIKVLADGLSVTYVVTEYFVVQPEEVWVLQPIKGKSVITLITCTPMENPTHRYIVRGEKLD